MENFSSNKNISKTSDSPIMKGLLQIEQISLSESKRRQDSNEMLKNYIDEYFEQLDQEISEGFEQFVQVSDPESSTPQIPYKITEIEESLSLLEEGICAQEEELREYIKDYDNGFDKILEVSKLSNRESKILKDRVAKDLKNTCDFVKSEFVKEEFESAQKSQLKLQEILSPKIITDQEQLDSLVESIKGSIMKEKELRRDSDERIVTTLNEMKSKMLKEKLI
ncbi:unnamed protein product [Moneuplotes crassus]|uniref:Uncharacterized protein n=1 Tax=Euplotes crassus TaxID=5936 RepID=A0AAD1XTK5_EUPCR|nr:unnamed protein product [Moneuplotes crassus]